MVIPAFNEGESIQPGLIRILDSIKTDSEVTVVVDSPDDSSIEPVVELSSKYKNLKHLVNDYGPGPASAIKFGVDNTESEIVIVTMADGCDDPSQVDDLAKLVQRGVVIAAASRYMPGGQQVGGTRFKRFLSRTAGVSFALFTGVGTRDATNSYKAYSRNFIREVGIDSKHGFEIGLELTAKARRTRQPVAEIPTTWIDRSFGQSNFKLSKWVPKYLYWYLYGLGFFSLRKVQEKQGGK